VPAAADTSMERRPVRRTLAERRLATRLRVASCRQGFGRWQGFDARTAVGRRAPVARRAVAAQWEVAARRVVVVAAVQSL
jgi:hypothetical protein